MGLIIFCIICALFGALADYFNEYWHIEVRPDDVSIILGKEQKKHGNKKTTTSKTNRTFK